MSEGTPLKPLPRLVEPRKLALANAKLAGIVPEVSLSRLREIALDSSTESTSTILAQAELELFRDEQGRLVVVGKVSAKLQMQCQRCLGPLEKSVTTEVSLAVVRDEEKAQQLPKHLEPWIVEDDLGDLHAMLEEELLLALPAFALHDFACIDADQLSVGDVVEAVDEVEHDEEGNPFNALASLKQTLKKSD